MGRSRIETYTGGKPVVSVIIPTVNEAKNLPLLLPYIPMDVVDEVILVDGQSKDRTVDVAKQLLPSIKVVVETEPGKGAALIRGYKESTGDILVVLDADGSHDPREIPRFVNALLEGADFAKGSRFAPSGGTTDMPRLRKYGNWGLTQLVNLLFAQSFTDLCYGYHAFWRHCLDFVDLENSKGFEVDTAIYLQALRHKLKVVDVPSFEGLRFYGTGKLETFPDGWRVLRTIMREWQAGVKQPTPEPQVGFRSYNLRSLSSQPAVPVTGDGVQVNFDGQSSSANAPVLERKPFTLEEFFRSVILETPREDIELLLSSILLEVMERLGASSGSLVVMDEDMQYFNTLQVFGRTTELVPTEEMSDLLQSGFAGWVLQNREPVLIKDTNEDPRWLSQPWEEEEGVSRSVIAVPFFRNDRSVSVFILTRPADRCFTEKELQSVPGMTIYL